MINQSILFCYNELLRNSNSATGCLCKWKYSLSYTHTYSGDDGIVLILVVAPVQFAQPNFHILRRKVMTIKDHAVGSCNKCNKTIMAKKTVEIFILWLSNFMTLILMHMNFIFKLIVILKNQNSLCKRKAQFLWCTGI